MAGERMTKAMGTLILSPFVLLMISSLRVLVIVNYDTSNATRLAQAAGTISTLVGTVIPLLPVWAPFLLVLFFAFRKLGLALIALLVTLVISPSYKSPTTALSEFAGSSAQFLNNIQGGNWASLWFDGGYILAFAAIGLLLSFGGYWWPHEEIPIHHQFFGRLFVGLLMGAACGSLVILTQSIYRVPVPDLGTLSAIARQPWIPPERITLSNNETRVGYVLSTSDDWFVVLIDDTRDIDLIPASDIAQRKACVIGSQLDARPIVVLPNETFHKGPQCFESSPPRSSSHVK